LILSSPLTYIPYQKGMIMCFSATASFTASATLLICSLFTLHRAQRSQQMIAAIPLLFALQQGCEGFIWQGFMAGTYPSIAVMCYLIFVYIVWPLWVPLSLRSIATPSEVQALRFPLLIGCIIGIVSAAILLTYPITAIIEHHHIRYSAPLPSWLDVLGTFLYLIATLAPFFMVKQWYAACMGIVLSLSYIVTILFFHHYLLSVWCFFATTISAIIFFIV
jgi:hypothetical protein